MSTTIYLDAVKAEPGEAGSFIPVLRTHPKEIMMWFDRHNSYDNDYLIGAGLFFEFSPKDIDELIKDCKDYLKREGWFEDNPLDETIYGDSLMDPVDCQDIIDTLEEFKRKQGEDWEKLWFLYSVC